jgi:hypothetical protein
MAEVKDKPADLPSTNALDGIDLFDTPPAYLSFGSSPHPMEKPPTIGEFKTYIVRVQCTGDSESVRDDGEHRYGRKLKISYVINPGDPTPPDPDVEQPALFDEDGEPADDQDGDSE